MNKSIRQILIGSTAAACCMALPLTASADNLVVHLKTGSAPHTVEISEQTKITFSNTTMNVASNGTNLSIDLSDIDHMNFDIETNSEDSLEASLSEDINFIVAGRSISASSLSGARISLLVYESTGRNAGSASGNGTVEFDFSNHAHGIYIICCNGKTIKYLNR